MAGGARLVVMLAPGVQVKIGAADSATWQDPTEGAFPQYRAAPGIRNAGVRNGDMWRLRPETGVMTWQMVHMGRPIRMRHVAPVKAKLTADLRWHRKIYHV